MGLVTEAPLTTSFVFCGCLENVRLSNLAGTSPYLSGCMTDFCRPAFLVCRLYVEDIDLGEGPPRQVVSGLAKFLTEDQMKASAKYAALAARAPCLFLECLPASSRRRFLVRHASYVPLCRVQPSTVWSASRRLPVATLQSLSFADI